MISFGFKSGIGTSSRKLPSKLGGYIVGVLVLSNFGRREDLRINGFPIGKVLAKYDPNPQIKERDSSIIVIIATNAPLSFRQLKRLAKRACHGIARVGGISSHFSGEFVIAFTTHKRILHYPGDIALREETLHDNFISILFKAVIEATEEAILNALFKSVTMDGRDNHIVRAIPIDKVMEVLAKYFDLLPKL